MRFDFSRLLKDIASRYRRFRGLSLASRVLVYGGGLALALGIIVRLLLPKVPLWAFSIAPFAALLASGIAFLVRWRQSLNLPTVLIRLDDALDTKARISSLYEVRERAEGGPIRDRLEALVAQATTNWEDGMPRPRGLSAYTWIGGLMILLSASLVILPLPALRTRAEAPLAQSSNIDRSSTTIPSAIGQEDLETASETESGNPAPLLPADELNIVDDPGSETSNISPPEDDLNLNSVMQDLQEVGGSSSSLVRNPEGEGLSELSEAQQQALQTLTEMVEEILEQMRSEGRSSMSSNEAEALQSLAAETGDPDLEDLTDELANDSEAREDAEDALQDLLNEIEEGENSGDDSGETMEGQSEAEQQDSTAVQGDEEAAERFLERTAQELEQQGAEDVELEGEQEQANPQSASSNPDEPSTEETSLTQVGENPEDDTMSGGAEGTPGEDTETGPEEEPQFVREEAPATIGAEGEFVNEFVTKGVPIETERATTGSGQMHRVDYARIDSILRQRGLPDEALDAVKRYFEAISQPEGGS